MEEPRARTLVKPLWNLRGTLVEPPRTLCETLAVRAAQEPSWNPCGTLVEPSWNPGETLVEPCLRAAPTTRSPRRSWNLVEPWWNPGGTRVKPWWNPGGTVGPSWNLVSGRSTPEPIGAETPKFSAVGREKKKLCQVWHRYFSQVRPRFSPRSRPRPFRRHSLVIGPFENPGAFDCLWSNHGS